MYFMTSASENCAVALALLLILEDDLPHAEVEDCADVDDKQQGADHTQGKH
jgi:hypothetical protein